MNNVKRMAPWLSIALVGAIMSILGCKDAPVKARERQVSECKEYKSPDACNDKETVAGKKCEWKNDECQEKVTTGQTDCEKIIDKKVCQGLDTCFYNTDNKCVDANPNEARTCAAIKVKAICDTHKQSSDQKDCKWNATAEPPVCGVEPVDIYTWTKMSLPGTADITQIFYFVMSKDKQHLYAYNFKDGEKGVYYRAVNGDEWVRMGDKDGNLIKKARADADDSTVKLQEYVGEFKATNTGAIAWDGGTSLAILEGNNVRWVIEKEVNQDTGKKKNIVKGYKDFDIKFIDVVKLNGVEYVVFAQNEDDSTNGGLLIHKTAAEFDLPATRIDIKKIDGKNFKPKPAWIRAGNTYTGDLLLASTEGIWQVPAANTLQAAARVAMDEPVLKPKESPGNEYNIGIMSIGGMDNQGTILYYAGLEYINVEKTAEYEELYKPGGLASHNGPQKKDPQILGFLDKTVMGIIDYRGAKRLVTDNLGILGVNADATPNTANDIKLDDLAANKNEMLDNKAAVLFPKEDNENLRRIYGDDDLSFYFVEGNGLYSRIKGSGQPRP